LAESQKILVIIAIIGPVTTISAAVISTQSSGSNTIVIEKENLSETSNEKKPDLKVTKIEIVMPQNFWEDFNEDNVLSLDVTFDVYNQGDGIAEDCSISTTRPDEDGKPKTSTGDRFSVFPNDHTAMDFLILVYPVELYIFQDFDFELSCKNHSSQLYSERYSYFMGLVKSGHYNSTSKNP